MNKQRQRHKRIKELWTRLVKKASHNGNSISPENWRRLIAQFKLDVGISDLTVADYLRTLRNLGFITDNWKFVNENYVIGSQEEFERVFRYYIFMKAEIPDDIKI